MLEIRMPKMGDGMDEGTILRWLKREGDKVAVEEPIAEIETDKANVEIPAEDAGVLAQIVVREGETVPVGAVIALLGSGAGDVAAPVAAAKPAAPAAKPAAAPKDAPAPASAIEAPAPAVRVKASPLAKRVAKELGIALQDVAGSGPGGRVVERDVRAVAEKRGVPAPPAPVPAVTVRGSVPEAAAPFLAGKDEDISRMRRAIARRTVQSKQTVPHFYITMPIDMDAAAALLEQINAQNPDQKITVNDLVVKACALALAKFPDVNVSYTPDDRIRRYETINIGIAVGTDDGLRIPVIPDCGVKSLRQISADAKGLIAKARTSTLTPQEMSGGTFSVSNLGMFGVEEFGAIINPPESAILAVGAMAAEVVVAPNGEFVAKKRMRVTLSCDHRTVDGLLGAKFLKEVRRLLEEPFSLLAWS